MKEFQKHVHEVIILLWVGLQDLSDGFEALDETTSPVVYLATTTAVKTEGRLFYTKLPTA